MKFLLLVSYHVIHIWLPKFLKVLSSFGSAVSLISVKLKQQSSAIPLSCSTRELSTTTPSCSLLFGECTSFVHWPSDMRYFVHTLLLLSGVQSVSASFINAGVSEKVISKACQGQGSWTRRYGRGPPEGAQPPARCDGVLTEDDNLAYFLNCLILAIFFPFSFSFFPPTLFWFMVTNFSNQKLHKYCFFGGFFCYSLTVNNALGVFFFLFLGVFCIAFGVFCCVPPPHVKGRELSPQPLPRVYQGIEREATKCNCCRTAMCSTSNPNVPINSPQFFGSIWWCSSSIMHLAG